MSTNCLEKAEIFVLMYLFFKFNATFIKYKDVLIIEFNIEEMTKKKSYVDEIVHNTGCLLSGLAV